MSTEYNIHGWHKDGPVYDEVTKGEGFRGRRRGDTVVSHGAKGGRNVQGAEHLLVGDTLLLNKGHAYEVVVKIDGTDLEQVIRLDATDGYKTARLADGLDVVSVREYKGDLNAPEPDDEDDVIEEDSSDEEE